ncbi:MAG: hypothetical protein FD153_398 [Rhodospirillaceae bacterium]|nr:MAG: hypothetical protein FD153_398 [Rhodospirillaceae bacterium]
MDMKTKMMVWDIVERDKYGRVLGMTSWPHKASDSRPSIFLVPVDGSPTSLSAMNVALRLADQRPNAELHVLNVQLLGGNDVLDNSVERQGLLETEEVRDLLALNHESYQLHIATGVPAQVIHDYSCVHNVAEIVIGTRGMGNFQRLLLGSVAMDVISNSLIPVTLVKSRDRAGSLPAEWIAWLIPFDGSPAALRAVRHAIRHVGHLESKPILHLLNVRSYNAADIEKAIGLLEMAKLPFDVHVEAGDPANKILEAIEQYGCGHIAMGSRGLGTLGGIVLGSVSQSVVQHAAIPVTLIK